MLMRMMFFVLCFCVAAPTASAQTRRKPAPTIDKSITPAIIKQIDPSVRQLVPLNKKVLYQYWGPSQFTLAPKKPLRALTPRATPAIRALRPDKAEPSDLAITRTPDYDLEETLPSAALSVDIAKNIGRIPGLNQPPASPNYAMRFTPPVTGVDPMVAAGEKYLVITQDHTIAFFDKSGNILKRSDGSDYKISSYEFFSGFVTPDKPDGSFNADNINRYLNFPSNAAITCDLTKATPVFPCVNEFYDTRVLYDAFHKRFVIISGARHQLWTDKPNGELSRRYLAIAVSRTDDPRQGFHQYMPTWSNYRDWPWMSINGDYLITAHKGSEDPNGPVAAVFHLPALMSGNLNPPHFKYWGSDIGGHGSLIPAKHYPGESALTWMLRRRPNGDARLFAFAPPTDPWTAPPLMKASATVQTGVGSIRDSLTYRHGRLQFSTVRSLGEFGYVVHVVRIPVSATANGISASINPADGFFDNLVNLDGDPSLAHRVSREVPSSAVNAAGDMLIAYGRFSMAGAPPILAEVRYAVWYHNEPFPRWSRILKEGEVQPMDGGAPVSFYGSPVDYSAVVIDPADGMSFWIAHEYGATAAKKSGHHLVIGKVTP